MKQTMIAVAASLAALAVLTRINATRDVLLNTTGNGASTTFK